MSPTRRPISARSLVALGHDSGAFHTKTKGRWSAFVVGLTSPNELNTAAKVANGPNKGSKLPNLLSPIKSPPDRDSEKGFSNLRR